MTMYDDSIRLSEAGGSRLGESATPAGLRAIERLLDRLGAHERAAAPFGMEDRVALGAGDLPRQLAALAAAERGMADEGLEERVYAVTRPIVCESGTRLEADAPAGLEERIFQATRGEIRGRSALRADFSESRSVDLPRLRIGLWAARMAAVLALGGGAWLALVAFRGQPSPAVVKPVEVVATTPDDDGLSFDEFDDVLESHMAFMRTVEYRPADVDVMDEDWCTSCELIELEEEISS
jgi:hypothetical protein